MANGQVEIHDMFSTTCVDSELTSDTENMEDSVEYRLLMVYAQRRHPQLRLDQPTHDDDNGHANASPTTNNNEEKTSRTTTTRKKKKKMKGWNCLPSIFKCTSPQAEEGERPPAAPMEEHILECRNFIPELPKYEGEEEMEKVVSKLSEIVDDVPFMTPEIETDAPESQAVYPKEVAVLVGLLLRNVGDDINEKELKDVNIAAELFWNYSFFKTLINALLRKMGLRREDPEAPGPQASPQTQMAVTCEFTSRLLAINTLPATRLMNHGARYVQECFSGWAQQRGGYEAAFEDDEVQ